jgi:hypothetical protein
MHDASHEERCLLLQAGELAPEEARLWEAESHACPGCRAFLASLQAASAAARRAAVPAPAWLDARVLGRAAPARLARPRWSRIGLSLAAAAAALALIFLPAGKRSNNLHWTNGIERDLTRLDSELADVSKDMALSSDSMELDADIRRIEELTKGLKKQAL